MKYYQIINNMKIIYNKAPYIEYLTSKSIMVF